MRDWSIGICTPIPRVPIDQEAFRRDKARQALALMGSDPAAARKLLEEATADPQPGATHLGLITPEWQRAKEALQTPMGHRCVPVWVDGREVGQARCEAVEAARQANLRYLFFLDWDVIVPQDTLMKLAYHLDNNPDYDVASGVYTTKTAPSQPLLWHDWQDGVFYDWTAGELLMTEILGVPMGCCLLRLSLFDRLPASAEIPWFKTVDQPLKIGGLWWPAKMTEDLWFCRRLHEEAQGKILVDGSILCHHICHHTGTRYKLGDDSLPIKRAKARAAARQEAPAAAR